MSHIIFLSIKKIYCFLIATALSLLSILSLQAQNTEGTEFWLTFGNNASVSDPSTVIDLEIRIVSGNKLTTGTIYFTNLDLYVNFQINAYEVHTHVLDVAQKWAAYNATMGTTNYSIHILCSEPVTVYALTHRRYTSLDVTNILPVTALGTEYYHISYTVTNVSYWPDAYAVVATQNNTQVYHNGGFITTLSAGQVYYRTSTDMTGTRITSNYPVAFFAIHQGAGIPDDFLRSGLMQQLSPVNTWGKIFFVPVTSFGKEFVRIVASQSGTYITQTGGTIRTGVPGAQTSLDNLQAGQFVELEIFLSNNGCHITANKPIAVCSFITDHSHTGLNSLPAQSWIPGVEQRVPNSLIAPFTPNSYTQIGSHYALISTPTATRDNTKVSIGGGTPEPLSGDIWRGHDGAGMSFYNFLLAEINASYVFSNPEGIIVLGYGKGAPYTMGSYYYLAYSAMRDLDAAFYVNDIHFQDLKENPFCAGLVNFRAEIEGLHQTHWEKIRWYVNGTEEPGTLNQETWQRNFTPGNYDIKMWCRYENDDTISKTGTLIIQSCNQSAEFYVNNVHYLTDTTFCNKQVNFRAEIEGLHPTDPERIKWYIDDVFETSDATWNKTFENGTYEIKLVVHYDNDTYATLIGTLKVQALWLKIKNVRY